MGRRERKKLQSRKMILEAAISEFSKKGYKETSVADIMAAADRDVLQLLRLEGGAAVLSSRTAGRDDPYRAHLGAGGGAQFAGAARGRRACDGEVSR